MAFTRILGCHFGDAYLTPGADDAWLRPAAQILDKGKAPWKTLSGDKPFMSFSPLDVLSRVLLAEE